MRAAVYEGLRTIRVQEVPDPQPTAEDLVLRVSACGICGSDLHSYTTGAFIQPGQVMGHEFCGEVVEVGKAVEGIAVGERVTAMPFAACYRCPACLRGDVHLCYTMAGHVIAYGLPGAFAEYVRVPRAVLGRNVFKLPPELSDLAGATVEPLAVAVHAVSLANPALGDQVVVVGAGLIGQCVLQVLKARGVKTVVVLEVSPTRAEYARRAGADILVDPSTEDAIQRVGERVGFAPGGRGATADVVFDCAGVPAALQTALRLVRPGGTLAITALYEEPVQLNPSRLVWGELRLVGTFGYRNEFPQAISLLQAGKVQTEPLVTDVFPLARTPEAFERQLDKAQALKVMIRP
ncbi:MAG: zinc-binding alcohol dehydrogenase [Candidatus Tectimicrobiota bacterium]|nr:MAG: zinc-binding alcohol dehydrogenase [Candidatus Tectomicrobia bacterium]